MLKPGKRVGQLGGHEISDCEALIGDAVLIGREVFQLLYLEEEICSELHHALAKKGMVSFMASRMGRPKSPATRRRINGADSLAKMWSSTSTESSAGMSL